MGANLPFSDSNDNGDNGKGDGTLDGVEIIEGFKQAPEKAAAFFRALGVMYGNEDLVVKALEAQDGKSQQVLGDAIKSIMETAADEANQLGGESEFIKDHRDDMGAENSVATGEALSVLIAVAKAFPKGVKINEGDLSQLLPQIQKVKLIERK